MYNRYYVKRIVGFIAILLILLVFLLSQPVQKFWKELGSVGIIIMLLLFCFLSKMQNKAENIFDGWDGEIDIRDELKKLPSEFKYIYDLSGEYGNVDFVVVGPSGVFAIEVKNIEKGLLDSPFFYRKNLKQARRGSAFVYELVKKNLGIDLYVEPVLVSAHKKVDVKFGFKKQDGVYVINIKWVQKFFEEYQPARELSQETIDKIYSMLQKHKDENK